MKSNYSWWKISFIVFFLIPSISIIFFSFYIYLKIPSRNEMRSCFTTTMYNVHHCSSNKDYVKFADISKFMTRAVVLTEDGKFWIHKGFDVEELKNSFYTNWRLGKYKRGGSTITQQLAKNLYLSKEKSLVRKIVEVFITMRLESTFSKTEILEKYLNVVQFGKNLFGIKNASQFYFKKDPKNLNANEAAFLAMLLPNPEKYSISFAKMKLTPFAKKRISQIVSLLKKTSGKSNEEFSSDAEVESMFNPQAVAEKTAPTEGAASEELVKNDPAAETYNEIEALIENTSSTDPAFIPDLRRESSVDEIENLEKLVKQLDSKNKDTEPSSTDSNKLPSQFPQDIEKD